MMNVARTKRTGKKSWRRSETDFIKIKMKKNNTKFKSKHRPGNLETRIAANLLAVLCAFGTFKLRSGGRIAMYMISWGRRCSQPVYVCVWSMKQTFLNVNHFNCVELNAHWIIKNTRSTNSNVSEINCELSLVRIRIGHSRDELRGKKWTQQQQQNE